jgi:hypothetical protein
MSKGTGRSSRRGRSRGGKSRPSNRRYGNVEVPDKIHSVTILGRRWFQRGPGNTYNTATIMVNGKTVHHIPYGYGYGQMYEQRAMEWLLDNGFFPGEKPYKHGGYRPLWQIAQDRGFHYESSAIDVPRKRDL